MAGELRRLGAIITFEFEVRAVTGLHIGGSVAGISIGGSDNPVIRDPLTGRPYIPGSSFKGKMRSLLERRHERNQTRRIGQVFIHTCDDEAAHRDCPVCPLFGIPAPQESWFCLTRLRFPDVPLSEASVAALDAVALDLPYTEVKTEVAIDRTTSAASPRNIERVPAGAVFHPAQIALFRYEGDPASYIGEIIEGLTLVEADYLGGSGARGSGRVAFSAFSVACLRFSRDAPVSTASFGEPIADVPSLRSSRAAIEAWI